MCMYETRQILGFIPGLRRSHTRRACVYGVKEKTVSVCINWIGWARFGLSQDLKRQHSI
jgi:hypothetical protein